jgi:hypothetical protein
MGFWRLRTNANDDDTRRTTLMKVMKGAMWLTALLVTQLLFMRESRTSDSATIAAEDPAPSIKGTESTPSLESGALFHLASSPRQESVWLLQKGGGDSLCEALFRDVQRYSPKQLGVCVPSIALNQKGITEFEGWTKLDLRAHATLYKELKQYDRVGVQAYFGENSERFQRRKFSDAMLEHWYQLFLNSGGQVRVNTISILHRPQAGGPTAAAEPRTVLELRTSTNKELCPDSPALPDTVQTFFVIPDLSGPSRDISEHEANVGSSARLVRYQDAPLVIYGTQTLALYREDELGSLSSFCEIQYRAVE